MGHHASLLFLTGYECTPMMVSTCPKPSQRDHGPTAEDLLLAPQQLGGSLNMCQRAVRPVCHVFRTDRVRRLRLQGGGFLGLENQTAGLKREQTVILPTYDLSDDRQVPTGLEGANPARAVPFGKIPEIE